MHESYTKLLEHRYLKPVKIKNKEYYNRLIYELEESLTSKIILDFKHSSGINKFITEIFQLLSHSITLYELGYFDNAYYSIRSSIELATIMLDLSDKDDKSININMNLFINKKYKKFRTRIMRELSFEGNVFKEIMKDMPQFKVDLEKFMRHINKIVHKTGFENFYCSQYYYSNNFHITKLEQFEKSLLKAIQILGIIRLSIDPLPLLLTDPEIYYRCPNFLTIPFNKELLNVIGEKYLTEFKQTTEIKSMYKSLLKLEKRNQETNDFIINNYINTEKIENIFAQKDLIPEDNLKYLNIANSSNKIIEIISYNGFIHYWTNYCQCEKICNPLDYEYLTKLKKYINIPYDTIYVSLLNINKNLIPKNTFQIIYVFHTKKLDKKEIKKLNNCIKTTV